MTLHVACRGCLVDVDDITREDAILMLAEIAQVEARIGAIKARLWPVVVGDELAERAEDAPTAVPPCSPPPA